MTLPQAEYVGVQVGFGMYMRALRRQRRLLEAFEWWRVVADYAERRFPTPASRIGGTNG